MINTRRACRTKHRGAFTLVELLVVVAIIALAGTLGGGMYMGTYKRMLVEKAARQLLMMARYARIMAVEQQQIYELKLDGRNNRFFLTTTALNVETGVGEPTIVRDYYCRPVELAASVKFENVQVASLAVETDADSEVQEQPPLQFLPNGSAASATIQLGDGQNHYTVTIAASTGRVKLERGEAKEMEAAVMDLDAPSR